MRTDLPALSWSTALVIVVSFLGAIVSYFGSLLIHARHDAGGDGAVALAVVCACVFVTTLARAQGFAANERIG